MPASEPTDTETVLDQLHGIIPATEAGRRLDIILAELFPAYSRSRLQQWLHDGLVTLNGETLSEKCHKKRIWGGELVAITIPATQEVLAQQPEDMALHIVYEDAEILVIDKPAGLVVHPGHGNWEGTLLNGLLAHCPHLQNVPRAGIVHRLDKDTSGLLVVAKTLAAQTNLVRQLQNRTVHREYWAVCYGDMQPSKFTVNAPIGRHRVRRTEMTVHSAGKEAITHVEVLERFGTTTLVQCRLATGRTHQIRVHLTHTGYPLVGDTTYQIRGVPAAKTIPKPALAFARQALHAFRLGLVHPILQQPFSWEAPLPQDFSGLLATLRHETV